jgi:hypothetical protein
MTNLNPFKFIFTGIIAIAISSCNSSGTKTDEAKQPETAATLPAASFDVVAVMHPVADYSKWLPAFNDDAANRKAAGLIDIGLGRGLDDSNMVVIMMKATDMQKAKEFSNSPGLKEAMQKAGVTAEPKISMVHVIRNDSSTTSQTNRMMVSHHVKDFNAWLKVYDNEGMAKRADEGFTDRALGRGIEDTNMVYLVFAVNDLAKAKASITSEAKKKLMTDAGVDGPPQMFFYNLSMLKE